MKPVRVYLDSLGCSKNLVDSEAALGFLRDADFALQSDPESADLLIVNTCGFIETAREQSVDRILELAQIKARTKARLLVMGCLSQRYADELAREIPEIDLLLGVGQQADLAAAAAELSADSRQQDLVPPKPRISFDGFDGRPLLTPAHLAWVKLGEGCSRGCSFCAIPGIRGTFVSRPEDEIVKEVVGLAARGVGEVNLISQDTAFYGKDTGSADLATLLAKLGRIEGLRWIRLFYFHPGLVSAPELERLLSLPRVVPYLDIPFQHASTRMLKLMRRGHDQAHLERLMTRLRAFNRELSIRSTVLVGHPGETEDDFAELLDFLERHPVDKLGVFGYSDEVGTHAASLGEKVAPEEVESRVERVQMLQMELSAELNQRLLGKRLTGVVEALADSDEGVPPGRELCPLELSPFPDSRAAVRTVRDAYEVDSWLYLNSERGLRIGDWVSVKVADVDAYDLRGELVGPAPLP